MSIEWQLNDVPIYITIGGNTTEIKPMNQEEHDLRFPPPIQVVGWYETSDEK